MRLLLVLMLALLVLLSAAIAVALDGGSVFTFKPGLAYRLLIPRDPSLGIQAKMMGELGATYNIPLVDSGEHNIKVGGGGGLGQDFTGAGFRIGYAYAPAQIKTVLFGLAGAFELTFPNGELANQLLQTESMVEVNENASSEAWLMVGLEGSIDFTIPGGLPASLIVGGGVGLRDSPDQFYFAFNLPLQSVQASEQVRASQ